MNPFDINNALAKATSEEDSYIAWARYTNSTIRLCDSDSPGAFRVYRHPKSADLDRKEIAQIISEECFYLEWDQVTGIRMKDIMGAVQAIEAACYRKCR